MAAAAAKPSEPQPTVSSPPPQPVSAQPRSCPSPSERRSDGSNEVRRIILETHAKLAHGTHYEVLGIEPNASDVEVRQASRRLIRLLHPDACGGPEFEDVQPQRAQAFVRVGQAFEVLHDLQVRAAYDKHLRLTRPDGGPTAVHPHPPRLRKNPVRLQRTGARMARSLRNWVRPSPLWRPPRRSSRTRRYWDAIQAVEPLVPTMDGAVRARARFVLARAYAKNPKWQHRAEQALKLVIEDDPRHVQAHALLAEIYAVAGLKALARGMYRKVLALDPHNALARARLDESDSLGSER